jgi:hypothetical protein
MESLGRDIRLPGACEQDFEQRNPIVVQAYAAFIAYEPLYKAGCLKSDKGNYCYLDALDGDTSDSDALLYWLPLGKNIPQTLTKSITCNECISGTMEIFRQYAGNASQPLHDTYPKAAAQINLGNHHTATFAQGRGIKVILLTDCRRMRGRVPQCHSYTSTVICHIVLSLTNYARYSSVSFCVGFPNLGKITIMRQIGTCRGTTDMGNFYIHLTRQITGI